MIAGFASPGDARFDGPTSKAAGNAASTRVTDG